MNKNIGEEGSMGSSSEQSWVKREQKGRDVYKSSSLKGLFHSWRWSATSQVAKESFIVKTKWCDPVGASPVALVKRMAQFHFALIIIVLRTHKDVYRELKMPLTASKVPSSSLWSIYEAGISKSLWHQMIKLKRSLSHQMAYTNFTSCLSALCATLPQLSSGWWTSFCAAWSGKHASPTYTMCKFFCPIFPSIL